MTNDWIHPELHEGEMFFINMSEDHFAAFSFQSKRRGVTAYDGEGHPLDFIDWFPVFVQIVALEESGADLAALRHQWRIQRTLMQVRQV